MWLPLSDTYGWQYQRRSGWIKRRRECHTSPVSSNHKSSNRLVCVLQKSHDKKNTHLLNSLPREVLVHPPTQSLPLIHFPLSYPSTHPSIHPWTSSRNSHPHRRTCQRTPSGDVQATIPWEQQNHLRRPRSMELKRALVRSIQTRWPWHSMIYGTSCVTQTHAHTIIFIHIYEMQCRE